MFRGPARYFNTDPAFTLFGLSVPLPATVPTAWVATSGQHVGQCQSADGANWLQVDTGNIPDDPRPAVTQIFGPLWGLHLYDVNLALGNLVDLVRQQSETFSP